jgi:hypothetical protein
MQLISPAPFIILLSLWPTLTCVPEPQSPGRGADSTGTTPYPASTPPKEIRPEELALRKALVRRENLWSAVKWSETSS